MVKKIALEEHFLCPGFEDYWKSTVSDVDPNILAQVVARLSDFGELRLQIDGRRRHRTRGAVDRRARRAGRTLTPPPPSQVARAGNDFLAREVQKRPDRYSGFGHLPMQDPKGAADELERCMTRIEVRGLHDQRPHQRAISRPSVAGAVLGTRRCARRHHLHPSDRSGDAVARARRPQGLAARDLGMDVRDRLARAAAGVRRRVRPLSARAHRARPSWARRCRICCGASTAAPSSTASSSPRRRRTTSRRTSW